MYNFYKKSELGFTIACIVIYCMVFGNLRASFGDANVFSCLGALILSFIFFLFIKKNNLMEKYGLTSFVCTKKYLYCIPFILLASMNLWFGIEWQYTGMNLIYGIVFMACVGFLEEIIFRGFLFKMMEKDNVVSAIIVSALTFGAGHIINLFTGHFTVDTILQVIYASTIGLSFVLFFYKSKSLLPCIVCHSLVDITYLFSNQHLSQTTLWISTYGGFIFIIVISLLYSIYLKNLEN